MNKVASTGGLPLLAVGRPIRKPDCLYRRPGQTRLIEPCFEVGCCLEVEGRTTLAWRREESDAQRATWSRVQRGSKPIRLGAIAGECGSKPLRAAGGFALGPKGSLGEGPDRRGILTC